jgi:hypothetical protein
MKNWLPYPENKPVDGWCATTEGGDIALVFWSNNKWSEDRGIVEFMQVTVNEKPTPPDEAKHGNH